MLDREKVLASKCRQKILRTLARNSQVRIMHLVRETGFSYNEVDRNLHVLEDQALIFQQRRRGFRVVSLNLENENLPVLLNVMKLLRTPSNSCLSHANISFMKVESQKRSTDYRRSDFSKGNFAYGTVTEPPAPSDREEFRLVSAGVGFVVDALSLLSLPMSARKVVMALYKMDRATVGDLLEETGLSKMDLNSAVNLLLRLGALKKKTSGQDVYFYIEAPADTEETTNHSQ